MRVLYATDGGSAARAAGKLLERIARRDGLEVTVVSVSNLLGIDPVLIEQPVEKSRAHAAEVAGAATEDLAEAGFAVLCRIAEGNPAAEILKLLEHDPHDLTLVGAGNKSWLGRLLHGSTSTHVLHSSPSAVLVVHEAAPTGRVRVLVAEDESKGSRLAGRLLADLADPKRCSATVLSVVTPVDLAAVPGLGELQPESIPTDSVEVFEIEKKRIAEGRERAERGAAVLGEAGFAATAEAVVGHPAEELLKRAEVGGFDLVVMGSRGRGTVGRTLLGSVSDAVSRHAPAALVARRMV